MNTKLIVRLLGYLIVLSGVFAYAQEDPRMWDPDGVILRQGDHLEWFKSNAVNEYGQTCVVWCDAHEGYWDIYAQVIAADGGRLWPDRGLVVCDAEWRQEDPVVVAVDGGWIVAWMDWRYGDRFRWGTSTPDAAIFAQKLSQTGEKLWATEGVEVYNSGGSFIRDLSIMLTDDHAGGAIIGWHEYSPGPGFYFRAQRVSSTGTLVWNEPVIVSTELEWSVSIQAVPDGGGNMLAVWEAEVDSGVQGIYGAKITLDGTLAWGDGAGGILLESFPGIYSSEFDICRDAAADGFYLAWSDRGVDYWDRAQYAQRFNGNGDPLWGESGIMLYEQSDRIYRLSVTPSFSADTQDGILLAGAKLTDSDMRLIAQKVVPNGAILWGEEGIDVCSIQENNAWEDPEIQTDFSGGLTILWNLYTNDIDMGGSFSSLKAARLDAAGNPLWGDCGVTLHHQASDWLYRSLLSYVPSSGFVRALFLDHGYLGFKSISFEDGNQISEFAAQITPIIRGEAQRPLPVSLADSRVAVVWEDEREGEGRLYYQIIDTLGTPEFEGYGARLLPEDCTMTQSWLTCTKVCSDEAGGFFTAATIGDYNNRTCQLYHLSIDESPAHELTQTVVADSITGYDDALSIIPDGSNGCYAAWVEYLPDFRCLIVLQRFNEQCEPQWNVPIQFEITSYSCILSELKRTSDNCCVIIWSPDSPTEQDISISKVDPSGSIVWSQVFLHHPQAFQSITCEPDNAGGLYVIWSLGYDATEPGIYEQHVDAQGNELWPQGDVMITGDVAMVTGTLLDEQNGLYIVWKASGLFGQRLDENGTKLWTEGGLQISSALDIETCDVTLNREGGILCFWSQNNQYYVTSLYGMNLLPDGTPASDWWTEGTGNVLAANERSVWHPQAAPFGDGSSLIVWEGVIFGEEEYTKDAPKPNEYYYIDLYMQRIAAGAVSESVNPDPPVPFAYALNQNYPNPFNPTTTISFSIAKAGTVSLVVYDLLGRSVTTLLNERLNSGSYQVPWDASSLPSGMYFYRLTAGEFSNVKKTVLLK
jgi:hypothetical protein